LVTLLQDYSLVALPAPALACLAGAYVAGSYLLARLSAYRGLRRLMRVGAGGRSNLLARLMPIYLLAGLAGLMLLGLGEVLEGWPHLDRVALAARVLALLPGVAAMLAYWLAIYPLERAVRLRMQADTIISGGRALPAWTRRQFLDFQLRQNLLLVLVPVLLLMLIEELLADLLGPSHEMLVNYLMLAAMLGVLVAAPVLIVRIWRTRSLPEGPLRSRLTLLCRAMGLTYRDIRLWQTDGVVVNAGVMGVLRPVRYVLLSDALLENMEPRGVEAVFAHEAGHIIHHHIFYTVLLTVGLLGLAGWAGGVLEAHLHLPPQIDQWLPVGVAGLAWIWLFGLVSRRFEWQADAHAASLEYDQSGLLLSGGGRVRGRLTPQSVESYTATLLEVARLNGIGLDQGNFRHGSIRTRVNRLWQLLGSDPSLAQLEGRMRRLRLLIWLVFLAALAAMLREEIQAFLAWVSKFVA
jgi:STE24 endopeptidase